MTKQIPINHKGEILYALVDDEDYPLLSRHCWYIRSDQGSSYPAATILTVRRHRKILAMHNMILGCGNIDHKSQDKLDNRKENLREATYQQNGWNKGKPSGGRFGKCSSQYKGVSKVICADGSVKYRVIIKLTKKGEMPSRFFRAGPFKEEIEAARVYNEEIVKLRPGFAWVNPLPE